MILSCERLCSPYKRGVWDCFLNDFLIFGFSKTQKFQKNVKPFEVNFLARMNL